MKIFGYDNNLKDSEELLRLSEISLQASPEVLREIAHFFLKAADEIEELKPKKPAEYHTHLRDNWKEWNDEYADIIVVSK